MNQFTPPVYLLPIPSRVYLLAFLLLVWESTNQNKPARNSLQTKPLTAPKKSGARRMRQIRTRKYLRISNERRNQLEQTVNGGCSAPQLSACRFPVLGRTATFHTVLISASFRPILLPSCRSSLGRLGMDTSVFTFDLPAWLSWSSNVLYIASFALGLLVLLLISCLVGQSGHSGGYKKKTHLAQ